MWEGPGFVDHHVHLLEMHAGPTFTDPGVVAAYHRAVAAQGSTPMDDPDLRALMPELLEGALRWAASLGLVEVTEAGLQNLEHLDALLRLRERGPLPVRVRILVASGLAAGAMPARTGDPWLEIAGVKFYADGWLGPRTCALRAPFSDRPGETGILFLDAETLARRAAPLAEQGWTIATHAIGDRAIEAVLDAYAKIWGEDCRAASPRIEHAQVIAPDLIARIAETGVVACIQPSFAQSDSAEALVALGEERARHAYAWDELLRAGARVICGSDYPIEDLSPLVGLRKLIEGAPVSAGLLPEQAYALLTDAAAGTTVLTADPRHGDAAVVETRPQG